MGLLGLLLTELCFSLALAQPFIATVLFLGSIPLLAATPLLF